ncbi:MAG: hypothetical protein ACM37Z_00910 [Deltaproteobacteria bacterium]
MKAHSETTFEVMHLLEEILDGFQDGYCRPANQIALYEKYLELRQTYNAKLIRHLIVIDGTRPSNLDRSKDHSGRNPKTSREARITGSGAPSWKQ